MIHIIALIGTTFLKQQSAQKKNVGPSVGSSKRPQVQSTARDVHAKESPIDPTTTVANDGDDGIHADNIATEPTVPLPLSSCYNGDIYDNSSSSWTAFRWAYY